MVVVVDGASPAPAAGSRFRRLLRRGLLIAALTVAGWLLTAMFANSASADEPPPGTPPAQDERPVSDAPADTPADEPVEKPGEQPGEEPAEEPGEQPAEEPGEQPGEGTGAEPAEEPVDLAPDPTPPATEPVTDPITKPVQEPAEPVTAPVPEPAEPVTGLDTPPVQGGLIGGLTTALGGITHAVADVADVVLDDVLHDAGETLAPIVEPSADGSLLPLPGLLPDLGQLPGLGGPLDPDGTSRAEVAPATPPAPPATPALPKTVLIAPEHTPRVAAAVGTPQSTSRQPGGAAEHADESGPGQPVKTPAAPVAPGGTFVSTAYDGTGGTRGPHGVLAEQSSLLPSTAGFTTRSRAADVTGRVAGLPAISPD